jgi:NAD(P)-dependent dehydrogenase (short-subunit alcohol dehydrogenase family)
VCPGFTDTDLLNDSIANVVAATGRDAEAARAEFMRHNPQGRLVRPDEVADAVAWLCSTAAGSVNGQSLSISGGEVM